MFKFENLNIYKEAMLFVDSFYLLTKAFPKNELFGLVGQLQRASVSIALNIAEGTSRTQKDFAHFLSIARGSCFECVALLQISLRQRYISQQTYDEYYASLEKLSKMINALKTSIKSSPNS